MDQSELPFRLLCRRYGTHLCYTPMVHARCFLEERRPNRTEMYYCNTTPDDTPTIAQVRTMDDRGQERKNARAAPTGPD